jgi:hypothetical protein
MKHNGKIKRRVESYKVESYKVDGGIKRALTIEDSFIFILHYSQASNPMKMKNPKYRKG